jgi:hypothetical protein
MKASPALMLWLLAEVVMAFVVWCADATGRPQSLSHRAVRAVLWPVTLARWCSHRSMIELTRAGVVVWFLVTAGWLLALEQDRSASELAFVIGGQVTFAFVAWCVDSMSADLHGRPVRRALRVVMWPIVLLGALRDPDSTRLVHANLVVWVCLTVGWLLALGNDRLAPAFG